MAILNIYFITAEMVGCTEEGLCVNVIGGGAYGCQMKNIAQKVESYTFQAHLWENRRILKRKSDVQFVI